MSTKWPYALCSSLVSFLSRTFQSLFFHRDIHRPASHGKDTGLHVLWMPSPSEGKAASAQLVSPCW